MVVLATSTAGLAQAGGGRGVGGGRHQGTAAVPSGVGSPAVAMLSLSVPGTPSSSPGRAAQPAGFAGAPAPARLGPQQVGGVQRGSQRSMWASTACVTSTGDSWRWR
jgi:hypothetical protein